MNLDDPISDIDVLVNSVTNAAKIGNLTATVEIGHLSKFYFEFTVYPSTAHTIWTIFVKQVMK